MFAAAARLKNTSRKEIIRKITTDYSYWLSFVVLLIAAVIVNPAFLRWYNITTLFVQGTIIGLIALGMNMVISAGQIDISVGGQLALCSGLCVVVLNSTGSILLAFLVCCLLGAGIGTINGLLVTKGGMPPMVATLALMAATRSVITQLGQGGPFTVADAYYESFRLLAVGSVNITQNFRIPYMMILFIVCSFIFNVIMTRTKFGKHIYAVGSNATAARLCGVNVHRVIIAAFAITGSMCGLGSVFYASRLTAVQASNAGLQFEMDAIAAVAIGGTSMTGGRGKVIGTFLGVLMFRMINNILSMANVPPFLSGFVSGCIIIVVVLMQNLQNKNR